MVRRSIAAEWIATFAAKTLNNADFDSFIQFVPQGAGRTGWTWLRGQPRAVASNMPRLAPDPDGPT